MTCRDVDGSSRRSSSSLSGAAVDADLFAAAVSEVNATAQKLGNVLAEQRRGKLDGRQVLADIRRERRKLIGQVGRYGIGSL